MQIDKVRMPFESKIMLNPVETKVLINLSDKDDELTELPGKIFYDHNEHPKELEINFSSIDQDIATKVITEKGKILDGKNVTLRIPDTPEIHTNIEFASYINFNLEGDVIARYLIGKTESGSFEKIIDKGEWVFQLTNVKLRMGDLKSEIPAPPGAPEYLRGLKFDKIPFNVAERSWVLKDDHFGKWGKKRARDVRLPVVTATLSTDIQAGDTNDSVCEVADTLAYLLSLAFARCVRVVRTEKLDSDGESIWYLTRSLNVNPFSDAGSPPIDNWQQGVLKGFIETAYPVVVADRNWWLYTLDMYMQVHVNPHIEVKSMLLNIIADRITTKVGVTNDGAEIDPDLDARIKAKDFKQDLHKILSQLSNNWTNERTANLISMIKMWNKKSSFPESIRRVCQSVGLKPLDGKILSTRHQLLHTGDLHPPDMSLDEYWKELDALVLLLILRLLKYDGLVYAVKFGSHEILLKDYLESNSNRDELHD